MYLICSNTYRLQYWTSNLKRRLKGSQVGTRTSNSGGQPIHLKLKTQLQDHPKTLFLNLKTQPQISTCKALCAYRQFFPSTSHSAGNSHLSFPVYVVQRHCLELDLFCSPFSWTGAMSNGNANALLTPSARISALNIVGDLLRKVGVNAISSPFYSDVGYSDYHSPTWKYLILSILEVENVLFSPVPSFLKRVK